MKPQLTLAMPTKNRPFFLAKTLRYYAEKKAGFVIKIGDGSDPAFLSQNKALVEKYSNALSIDHRVHSPDTLPINSTVQLLADIETPYAVWTGDDDFLVPETTDRCVDFLNRNADYSLCGGKSAWVYVEEAARRSFVPYQLKPGLTLSLTQDDAERRLIVSANPSPRINTFLIQRTDNMRYAWTEATRLGLSSNKFNQSLHELSVNTIALIQGKQMLLSPLYHVMLRHTVKQHASQTQADSFDRFLQWNWSGEVRAMVRWWAEELAKKTGRGGERSYAVASAVFLYFIDKFVTTHRDQKLDALGLLAQKPLYKQSLNTVLSRVPGVLRWWRRKIGESEFTLAKFLDKGSPYFGDFEPVYRVITAEEPHHHAENSASLILT